MTRHYDDGERKAVYLLRRCVATHVGFAQLRLVLALRDDGSRYKRHCYFVSDAAGNYIGSRHTASRAETLARTHYVEQETRAIVWATP